MKNEVDISIGFVEGYSSGRCMFGEWGHWYGEECLGEWEYIEDIKYLVCLPQPPKVSYATIWKEEEIALSFN